MDVAREQVRNGANLIDVNMDEGLIDSEAMMTKFLNIIATEPEIASVPIMIDSSKWSVLEAGLKCIQGKPVVNSISLKEGEAVFLEQAKAIHRYGAAVIVMGFDEQGQAETVERKVETPFVLNDFSWRRWALTRPISCTIPTCSLLPREWRSTTPSPSTSSRRPGVFGMPDHHGQWRHQQPVLLVPRQRPSPTSHARILPFTMPSRPA